MDIEVEKRHTILSRGKLAEKGARELGRGGGWDLRFDKLVQALVELGVLELRLYEVVGIQGELVILLLLAPEEKRGARDFLIVKV